MNFIKDHLFQWAFLALLVFILGACQPSTRKTAQPGEAQTVGQVFTAQYSGLSDYWYQGKAEITSYELSQNRYADTHPGEAVMIFVTEDFLTGKQVKDEFPLTSSSTLVLKNNQLRKFPTGIYDYSVMTSVFTPVEVADFPHTLKVSTSSQEWCGQTYMQINKENKQYRMQLHSYFEKEADEEEKKSLGILEDELFNRIRINPAGLPTGKLKLFPGTVYCRLTHAPFELQAATASLESYEGSTFEGSQLRVYRIEYPEQRRTLEIVFESKAPHVIAGWTDTYPSVSDGVLRTTTAKRKKTLLDPYWQHNSREDEALRRKLEIGDR